jgi:hypothetical protein
MPEAANLLLESVFPLERLVDLLLFLTECVILGVLPFTRCAESIEQWGQIPSAMLYKATKSGQQINKGGFFGFQSSGCVNVKSVKSSGKWRNIDAGQ